MSKKPAPKMEDPRVAELQATFEVLGRGGVEVRSVDSFGNIVFKATEATLGVFVSMFTVPVKFAASIWRAVSVKEVVGGQQIQDIEIPVMREPYERKEAKEEASAGPADVEAIDDERSLVVLPQARVGGDLGLLSWIEDNVGVGKAVSRESGIVTYRNAFSSKFLVKKNAELYAGILKMLMAHPGVLADLYYGRGSIGLDRLQDFDGPSLPNAFIVKDDLTGITTMINVSAIKQYLAMSKLLPIDASSMLVPSIMPGEDGCYRMPITALQEFVGTRIAPVIFQKMAKGLKPIAMITHGQGEKVSVDLSKHGICIDLVLDNSQSLDGVGKEYRAQVKNTLEEISSLGHKITLRVTKFSGTIETAIYRIEGSLAHDSSTINNILRGLSVDGGYTALYDSMKRVVDGIMVSAAQYSHHAMIVFTDGQNNSGKVRDVEVVSSGAIARDGLGNFQVFTIELGDGNKKFFGEFSVSIGAKHINIRNIEEMASLNRHIGAMTKESAVIKFIIDSAKPYVFVAPNGEISVSDHLVEPKAKLTINSTPYTIVGPELDSVVGGGEGVGLAGLGSVVEDNLDI